jgi:hypothetical protein
VTPDVLLAVRRARVAVHADAEQSRSLRAACHRAYGVRRARAELDLCNGGNHTPARASLGMVDTVRPDCLVDFAPPQSSVVGTD